MQRSFLKIIPRTKDIIKNGNPEPFLVVVFYRPATTSKAAERQKLSHSGIKDVLRSTREQGAFKGLRTQFSPLQASERGSASTPRAKHSFLYSKLSPLEEPLL